MLDPKLLPDWKDDGLADAIHQFPCNQQSAIPSVDYDGEYAELQKWGFGGRISISMMVIPSRRHQIYRLLDPALRSSDLFSRKYYSPRPTPGHMVTSFSKRFALLGRKLEAANAAPSGCRS